MRKILINVIMVVALSSCASKGSARRVGGAELMELLWVCDVPIAQLSGGAWEIDPSSKYEPIMEELAEGKHWNGNCIFFVQNGQIINAQYEEQATELTVSWRY